jgi:hypothetical protein
LKPDQLRKAERIERRKLFVPQLSAFVEETDAEVTAEDDDSPLADGPPVLHRLCEQLEPTRFEQFEAMGAYLREVLNSNLPMEHKEAICVSAHPAPDGSMVSAAQWALIKGSPAAAAQIVLAVLESGMATGTIKRILGKIGVDLDKLALALSHASSLALAARLEKAAAKLV